MNRLVIISLLTIFVSSSLAQVASKRGVLTIRKKSGNQEIVGYDEVMDVNINTVDSDTLIYLWADRMPTYIPGKDSLEMLIEKKLKDHNAGGRETVLVKILIEKDSVLSRTKCRRTKSRRTRDALLDALDETKTWYTATLAKKNVRSMIYLHIDIIGQKAKIDYCYVTRNDNLIKVSKF